MTPRASKAKPTVWRESTTLLAHERAKHWARRAGYRLEVILAARKGIAGNVVATVETRAKDWAYTIVEAQNAWTADTTNTRQRNAQIAVAERWAEMQADRLAGERA